MKSKVIFFILCSDIIILPHIHVYGKARIDHQIGNIHCLPSVTVVNYVTCCIGNKMWLRTSLSRNQLCKL